MLRQSPGDLLEVLHEDRRYYLLVLTRGVLFGGNVVFAFYRTTNNPLTPEEVLASEDGFNVVVDLLLPRRSNQVSRLAKVADFSRFLKTSYFKGTNATKGRADQWWVSDLTHKNVLHARELPPEYRDAMDHVCYSFPTLAQKILERYHPSQHPRL